MPLSRDYQLVSLNNMNLSNHYAFVLEFGDLGEELVDDLIDRYISFCYCRSEGCGVAGLLTSDGDVIGSQDDWLENQDLRESVSDSISCHFPVYA